MTLRVNTAFGATLSAAMSSNNAWSSAFKAGLGNARRVICKIAPLGTAQADVYDIGTKFRDAAINGTMGIEGGVVTGYGITSNLTTATAADLAAGVAVLRIEGNGNWVEGTLGLPNSGCDFIFPSNPTTTNSIAVTPNLRIKPPPFLPSGTGYVAPSLSAEAPAYVIIEDWRDPSNVIEAGRIHFDKRLENWTFADDEMADEMGDIRVAASTEKVVLGEIEFGAIMFSMNAEVNSETGRALHQVVIAQKPTQQNWPNYPRSSGYRMGSRTFDATVSYGLSNTFAPPFKGKLCKTDGSVLHVWDMPKDHLPINSQELSEFPTATKAMRLHMNCGQLLFWESHKPKMSRNSKIYFPGMDMRNLRPGMHKEKASYAGVYRAYTFSDQMHGLEHWFGAPRYAHAASQAAYDADPVLDPYQWTNNPGDGGFESPQWAAVHGMPSSDFGKQNYSISNIHGLFYEPGNHGCHNHCTGPGGVRIDRSWMAGPTMIHLTDPTFVHMRSNTSIDVLAKHWNLNYFNHACHFLTGDIRDFKTLPFNELLDGKWAMNRVYYKTDATTFTPGGADFAVPAFAVGPTSSSKAARPHNGAFTDENYRMPWNGYAVDGLHDLQSPADVAIHYNSPAHAYSAKHRYVVSLMCNSAASNPNVHASEYFGKRGHAWRLLQHARMWKLASDHDVCGVSRAAIETRLLKELTRVYHDYYVPMWVEDNQDTHMQCLKRFGVPIGWTGTRWSAQSFGLTFYMGGVLMFMRQIGLFNKLWNMGEIPQKALLCTIRVLDAASIQWFTQTRGSYMNAAHLGFGKVFSGGPYMTINETDYANPNLPTSWAHWRDTKWPLVGQEDWIHDKTGAFSSPDSSEHLKSQWPSMRLAYFRDIECLHDWEEVQEAKNIVDDFNNQWQAKIDAAVASGTPKNSMRLREWHCPVGYAQLQAPNPADVKDL